MLIKIVGGIPAEYSLHQLRADFPGTSFPVVPSSEQLAAFGVFEAAETSAPEINQLTHTLDGYTFEQGGDAWVQAWIVRELSTEEAAAAIAALRAGMACTQRQARLALLGAGLLSGVQSAIEAMPSEQATMAQIEWEYASEIRRDSALVAGVGSALGMSDAALDALFAYAVTL